jgi:glycosyltransferase involved in cell wall biosynthesis
MAGSRECDVFLSTNSYLTPWVLRIPAVSVIHDMVTFDRALEPNRRSALIERLTLGIAVRRSVAFVAVSQATARDFVRRFPDAAGRVTVALHGTPTQITGGDEDDALPPPGFVLAVGTLEPRKNLRRLVEAYALLDEELQRRHPLVVVGALGWRTGETLGALRSLGDRCIVLGHVSDQALAQLYERCAVFCYPSLYEGFGLPVLEAMAAGAAVVTSPTSSLPEVGGDAVRYADPSDARSLAEAIGGLLSSSTDRAELGAAARERSRKFDWDTTADVVLGVLRQAAARGAQAVPDSNSS